MRLSEERAIHLAHKIVEGLLEAPKGVHVPDPVQALKAAKEAMLRFVQLEEEMEAVVRQKLARMPKAPPEGSTQWRVLFDQYLGEERVRRGLPR